MLVVVVVLVLVLLVVMVEFVLFCSSGFLVCFIYLFSPLSGSLAEWIVRPGR